MKNKYYGVSMEIDENKKILIDKKNKYLFDDKDIIVFLNSDEDFKILKNMIIKNTQQTKFYFK